MVLAKVWWLHFLGHWWGDVVSVPPITSGIHPDAARRSQHCNTPPLAGPAGEPTRWFQGPFRHAAENLPNGFAEGACSRSVAVPCRALQR